MLFQSLIIYHAMWRHEIGFSNHCWLFNTAKTRFCNLLFLAHQCQELHAKKCPSGQTEHSAFALFILISFRTRYERNIPNSCDFHVAHNKILIWTNTKCVNFHFHLRPPKFNLYPDPVSQPKNKQTLPLTPNKMTSSLAVNKPTTTLAVKTNEHELYPNDTDLRCIHVPASSVRPRETVWLLLTSNVYSILTHRGLVLGLLLDLLWFSPCKDFTGSHHSSHYDYTAIRYCSPWCHCPQSLSWPHRY